MQNLAKFSANPGKADFEGLLNVLRYIRDNTTLGLKYYDDMNDTPLSDLLRPTNIKTENQLMVFSDYICQDCIYTGINTVAYIIFINVGQLNMAHMFHYQLLNQFQKVITM